MHRLTNDWMQLGWTHLWQVTLLAVAVWVTTRILGRHRPHVGYVLWMLVIVKCLTPPIWASPVGLFSLAQSPRGVVPAALDREAVSGELDVPEQGESGFALQQSSASSNRVENEPVGGSRPTASFDFASIATEALAGIWLAGVVGSIAAIFWKWCASRALGRGVGPTPIAEFEQQMQKLAERISVRAVP